MSTKQFQVHILYQGALDVEVNDDLLIIRDYDREEPEARLRLSRNPEWTNLVDLARGDLDTVTITGEMYNRKFRKVKNMVVYHATGEVQSYGHGEILPGRYDHVRHGWVSHFGEPYLEK